MGDVVIAERILRPNGKEGVIVNAFTNRNFVSLFQNVSKFTTQDFKILSLRLYAAVIRIFRSTFTFSHILPSIKEPSCI